MVKYGNCSWIISRRGVKERDAHPRRERSEERMRGRKKKVDDGTRDVLF